MSDLHDLTRLMESELASAAMLTRTGKVTEVVGTLMRVSGLDARLGELCEVLDDDGSVLQMAEVVGFAGGRSILSPFGSILGVRGGTRVIGMGKVLSVPVGDALLGRVI